MVVGGSGNLILRNVVTAFDGFGIGVVGTNIRVINNVATGSAIDLEDFSGNCDSNIWRANTFGTSLDPEGPSPSCIQ
jgi:hypothetical protein